MSRFSEADKMFTEEEIKRKRARIYRKMLKSGTTTDLKEGRPDLRLLFELYDKNFFRGQIQKKLDETKSTLEFTFSKHTKTGGTCSRIGCNWKINIPIKLFQGLFQRGEKNLLTNGIWCTSKLDCLQLTFEHELMHLLMQLYKYQGRTPAYDQPLDTFTGHGKLFQCMVFLYFGHTGYKHDLFGGEASTKKIKKEDAREGMRVKFFSRRDQEEYHGRITKLNPKTAAVTREDGKKWRVPYTMLERSDKSGDTPDKPSPSISTKAQFKVGMRVTYFHKGKDHYGVIERINKQRASIKADDGSKPLVPYHMLKRTDKLPPKVLPGDTPPKKSIKDEIQVGDWVRVKWKDGTVSPAKVIKKNPARAVVQTEAGKEWDVYYQVILGTVSNESRKNKFKVGDKVSYVIDFRGLPGGLSRRGVQTYHGTIIEKTPENAVIKTIADKDNRITMEYYRLTKIDSSNTPQQTPKKKDISPQKPKKQIIKKGDTVTFKSTEKLYDFGGKENQYTGVVIDFDSDDEGTKTALLDVKDPTWEKYDVYVSDLRLVSRKESR